MIDWIDHDLRIIGEAMRELSCALAPAAYGAGSMAIVLYLPTLAAILFGMILMGSIIYMIAS